MSEGAIKWEDPPENAVWAPLLEPVMERPGKWAFVRTMKTRSALTQVWRLRNDIDVARPPGEWEFQSRVRGDLADIYAMYVGPEPDDER